MGAKFAAEPSAQVPEGLLRFGAATGWGIPPRGEDDALGAATPSSLPVDDLELQVAIELDRFPVTLGELQRWREGEVLNLRQGPSDPVRLVVET